MPDMQQAGRGAVGQRLLCDQFFGKVVVEFGNQHMPLSRNPKPDRSG